MIEFYNNLTYTFCAVVWTTRRCDPRPTVPEQEEVEGPQEELGMVTTPFPVVEMSKEPEKSEVVRVTFALVVRMVTSQDPEAGKTIESKEMGLLVALKEMVHVAEFRMVKVLPVIAPPTLLMVAEAVENPWRLIAAWAFEIWLCVAVTDVRVISLLLVTRSSRP